LLRLRRAVRPLHHLLALAGNDEDDLLRARMIVPAVPLARRQVDHAAREGLRPVHLRCDGERQLAPVETEGADIARIDEVVLFAHWLLLVCDVLTPPTPGFATPAFAGAGSSPTAGRGPGRR